MLLWLGRSIVVKWKLACVFFKGSSCWRFWSIKTSWKRWHLKCSGLDLAHSLPESNRRSPCLGKVWVGDGGYVFAGDPTIRSQILAQKPDILAVPVWDQGRSEGLWRDHQLMRFQHVSNKNCWRWENYVFCCTQLQRKILCQNQTRYLKHRFLSRHISSLLQCHQGGSRGGHRARTLGLERLELCRVVTFLYSFLISFFGVIAELMM